jgi:hypothetical protein
MKQNTSTLSEYTPSATLIGTGVGGIGLHLVGNLLEKKQIGKNLSMLEFSASVIAAGAFLKAIDIYNKNQSTPNI